MLMKTLKVTKKQGFTLSLKDSFLTKPQKAGQNLNNYFVSMDGKRL